MSDDEDAGFFRGLWPAPLKSKPMKDYKKNKKAAKHKKRSPTKTKESVQKKKKKSKFKEAMKAVKEKKKEKRKEKDRAKKKGKKKNRLAPNPDDDELFEGGEKLATCQNETLNSLSEKPVKETKKKKMVAFGSLPSYIRVKRPVFTSSSPKETGALRKGESYSQVMGKSHTDNDYQYNSDDINSQDLFITQKTFRARSPETSGSESSDGIISASPRVFMQRDENRRAAAGERKRYHETSDKGQDRPIHLCVRETETDQEEEIDQLYKHSSQAGKKAASGHEKHNPFLDEPMIINPTPDALLIKQRGSYRPYTGEPPPCPALANTSTQTENFFTAELSSFLSFSQKNRATLESQNMKPLDLSLPQRARGEQGKVCRKHKAEKSLEQNAAAGKKEPSCENTPSPQSEAETKSANTTTSSEDDHHCHAGRKDLSQVGVVQLRLNKPFFFKTKGEGQSPRPYSPLMKLAQGRDVESKKCRSGRK